MRLLAQTLVLGLTVTVVTSSMPAPAVAAGPPQVRVFQRKGFLRRERAEIAPYAGFAFNDSLVKHYYTGARLNYHLSEVLAVGVSGAKAFGSETALFEKVQRDYELQPTVSKTEWLAMVEASYAFLYGKFVLFNSLLVSLDSSLVGGVGAVGLAGGGAGAALDYGIGQRFFLTRWLSLNLDLRQYSYLDEVRGKSGLFHATTFTAGIGIFVPDFEYQTFR
jgi:outer membrane beta-barrel protein